MELNDIVYGNPPFDFVRSWKDEGLKKFQLSKEKGILEEFIKKYPHPKNDSEQTKNELKYLTEKGKSLTEKEKKLCKQLDDQTDMYNFFSKFAEKFGITVSAEELDKMTDEYWGIVSYIKFRLNRPRPFQLSYYYKLPLFPFVKSTSANSASYPSGHIFEFLLIIDYLTKKNPELKDKFGNLYKQIRNVREWSGVHYPSDTKGSEMLFKLLKEKGII
jgi:hypothetical protein